MRIKFLLKLLKLTPLVLMFINVNLVLAQQITLKNDKFVTELSIKVNPEYLASYYRGDNNITIRFKSKVKLNLIKLPENPFIEEINSNNNVLNVQIKNNINTYIEKNQNGLTIILAKSKQFDNLLKTEINPPIMVENDTNIINNEAENMLIKIDDAISRKNYLKAVNMIQEFLKTNPNGFYAIEAYYKLGETYMKMGDTSNRYYEISAEIFDNFTEKYPYYFRYNDALWNAAEASYKSHNYNKSLNYYNMVYEKQPSSDRGKIALYRIGDIYKDIGLYDKAIFTFIDYLNKYDKNNANIKNIIGYLYAKVNDYVSAYEYFYDFIKQGRFDFEKPDILFEIAKTLENKSLFDDALNVYKYIYTDKKDSTFADDSMFKSAMIYEKKGDYKLTDELLLNCKNSYPNSEGGYSCSLYYANKHLYEKEPDYWKDFLSNVLYSADEDLKAQGLYLLLNAYYKAGNLNAAFDIVKQIETSYLNTSVSENVGKIKQEILYTLAEESLDKEDIDKTRVYINNLLEEFPSTEYKDKLLVLQSRMKQLVEEKKRKDFIASLEKASTSVQDYKDFINFIDELRRIAANDNMTDIPVESYIKEVYPRFIDYLYKIGDLEGFNVATLDYVSLVGFDNVDNNTLHRFYNILIDKIAALINNNEFINAVTEYEKALPLVLRNNDADDLYEYIAYALYNLDEIPKAKNIYLKKRLPPLTQYGKFLQLALTIVDPKTVDLDNYSEKDISFIIPKLSDKDPLLAYNLLSSYNKNDNLSFSLKYDLIQKNVDNDTRSNFIVDFYTLLSNKGALLKKKYSDIIYQTGIIYFEDGNYDNAIKAFSDYEKNAESKNNLPQTFYFLGKSYQNKNQFDMARDYFTKLVNNFPDSPLSSLAKQELEKMSS